MIINESTACYQTASSGTQLCNTNKHTLFWKSRFIRVATSSRATSTCPTLTAAINNSCSTVSSSPTSVATSTCFPAVGAIAESLHPPCVLKKVASKCMARCQSPALQAEVISVGWTHAKLMFSWNELRKQEDEDKDVEAALVLSRILSQSSASPSNSHNNSCSCSDAIHENNDN